MKNSYKTVNINEIKYVIKNDNDLIQKFLLNNRQWNNNILHIIGQLIKRFNPTEITVANAQSIKLDKQLLIYYQVGITFLMMFHTRYH